MLRTSSIRNYQHIARHQSSKSHSNSYSYSYGGCSPRPIIGAPSTATTILQNRNYTSYKNIKRFPLNVDYTTTDHNYIRYLADNLPELGPYPTYSKYVNPLHFYQNTVMSKWVAKKAHPVTLRQLANFGKKLTQEKVIASANFVRLEVAIRIAKKLRDLQVLPYAAISNHHLVRVYESYYNIFENFRKIRPITTLQENDEFCKLLSKMLKDNLLSLPHLIMGSLECSILNSMTQTQLDEFMSSTLRARISRRLMCEAHLSLTDKFKSSSCNVDKPESDYIGDVFYKCSAVENLRVCGEIAKKITQSLCPPGYLMPEVIIEGDDVKFQFMVTHLRYLFGEILRNSYESTMHNFILNHADKPNDFFKSNKPPPILVNIVSNKETVNFRFSDQGGGVKGIPIDLIWSFGKNEKIARQALRNFHKLPGLQWDTDYNPINYDSEDYYGDEEPALGNRYVSKNGENEQAQQQQAQSQPTSELDSQQIEEVTKTTSDIKAVLNKTSLAGHYNDSSYFKTEVKNSLQNLMERPSNFKLNLGLAMCKVYADYWNGNLLMNSLDNYGTDTYLTLQRLGTNDELRLDKA